MNGKNKKIKCNSRCKRQWSLSLIVFPAIVAGYWYPFLGFIVPVTMLTGMIGGLRAGRWVCGNLCPRGSFWDRQISLTLKNERDTPKWIKNFYFRWTIFVFMISFMFYRASADITNLEHWGRVFWLMCTVTTVIGLIGAFFYHRRFWCVFCPIGTFSATVSGHKNQLIIDDTKCISCHLCDRACPIQIKPEQYRKVGKIADRDCIRCQACIDVCPKNAISLPEK